MVVNNKIMNNQTEQIYLITAAENQSTPTQKIMELTQPTQVNLENVEDFSNVCRTCATITEFVIPIFEGEGLQNNLAEKIHRHLPIKVSEDDVLPRVVCYQCASTLLAWHELVQCCVQADTALRTRLLVLTENKEKEKVDADANDSARKEDTKFKEIADFVVQTMEPPEYVETSTSPPVALKTCGYCNAQVPEQDYNAHLVSTHSSLLFHCDECDTYVDKKDFILHMSVHAVQYASNRDKIEKKKKVKKKKTEEDSTNDKTSEKGTEKPKENVNGSPNEFSDHSDMEYFGIALPESVFEAIEDSQDSQVVEDPNKSASNESNVKSKDEKAKKPRTCPICAKVYTVSSSYFYHMKNSHKITKDFECETCGKKFGTKASLVQHDAVHTAEYKYSCKICVKKFRSKASLYIHEQTHNGIKSYSCTQCRSSFRWRTHLLRHMKRHSAEKGHICSTCGRGFNIRCDLLRHARTHNAGNYACEKCGLKFSQMRYLKVHMVKKHSAPACESQNDVSQSSSVLN